MLKKEKNSVKCFKIVDKVNGETMAILQAKNEKDCIRNIVFSGFFKVNRLIDTKVIECEMPKDIREINIETVLKDLSISLEDKAEKVAETPKEVEDKIKGVCGSERKD